jgi:hypothetical protein
MPATLDPERIAERRERTRSAVEEGTRASLEAEAAQRRMARLRQASEKRAQRAKLVLRRAHLLK